MRVLCIMTVYNEIRYLPLKWQYCQNNGLYIYVIDNYSDDGTWEWLQKNLIPSHRFDTGGVFDLPALQSEIIRTVHNIKPDWVIYNGADLFPVTTVPFIDTINEAERAGYNAITMECISMQNTGEHHPVFDPFSTYFYFEPFKRICLIHKYVESFRYDADSVAFDGLTFYHAPGVMINYGNTKPAAEREKTLERRRKAWAKGMNPHNGAHLSDGAARGWVWDKNKLKDIRGGDYWPYIQILQTMVQ